MTSTGRVRRAEPADIDALVTLRAAMLRGWGEDVGQPDWESACRTELARRLATEEFAAFVAEDGAGAVVASGVGWVEWHLPSPNNPSGRRGYIASMSTLSAARRQGHGGRVLAALLAWLDELGVTRVDLRASTDGEPLYRAAGFVDAPGRPLSRLR